CGTAGDFATGPPSSQRGSFEASKRRPRRSNRASLAKDELITDTCAGARDRSRGQLNHLRRGQMESGGAPGTQLRHGPHDASAAVEKYRVDGELHEERVDRIARRDDQRVTVGEGRSPQQPEDAIHHCCRPFHAFRQNDVASGVDEPHLLWAHARHACTKATRGPARTIRRPGALSISPSRKYPNGRGARSSTSSATASRSRSRRAGLPKSSRGTSRAKLRGPAVRPSTWNDPGCSVARRNGRRPRPAAATLEPTTPEMGTGGPSS